MISIGQAVPRMSKLLEIEIIINFLSIFNNQFHALFVDENALLISSGYWNRSGYLPISVSVVSANR